MQLQLKSSWVCDTVGYYLAKINSHIIKKSQLKMTGVDRLSSTMKVCSACRFPRLTYITDIPEGKIYLPSALTN